MARCTYFLRGHVQGEGLAQHDQLQGIHLRLRERIPRGAFDATGYAKPRRTPNLQLQLQVQAQQRP